MDENYIQKRIDELTKDYTSCISGLEDLNRQKVLLNNRALTISGQIQELKLMQEEINKNAEVVGKPDTAEENKDSKK